MQYSCDEKQTASPLIYALGLEQRNTEKKLYFIEKY